jgi:hypothetical protein
MVIRHGEKPGTYNGQQYDGVDAFGTVCGAAGDKHLVTLGWERAGGLVTLFAPPWGPKTGLATPQFLYASDPDSKSSDGDVQPDTSSEGPSQRPYETLTAVAASLNLTIDKKHSKKHYDKVVADALKCPGVVLISWQHQDIPLEAPGNQPGLSQCILTQTGTPGTMGVPATWPTTPGGASRYDLVFVFNRPTGSGPITGFTVVPQWLLAGDLPWLVA